MPATTGLLGLLKDDLEKDDWGSDGLLHASELADPLRHVQLRMAGAPRKGKKIAEQIRLKHGQLWHEHLGEVWQGRHIPIMREVSITRGLPDGWGGTADFLLWDIDRRAFLLYDLKTMKGEGLKYIERDGAKAEHVWQTSAYWWALHDMGFPLVNRIGVIYLPMNEDYSEEDGVEPVIVEVVPLPKAKVHEKMACTKAAVDTYLESLEALDDDERWKALGKPYVLDIRDAPAFYLTPELADPTPREQKLVKKGEQWDVVLMPHWTADFCPYSDELCPCGGLPGEPRTTKVGQFVREGKGWVYQPRKGYELTEPTVAPVGVKLKGNA